MLLLPNIEVMFEINNGASYYHIYSNIKSYTSVHRGILRLQSQEGTLCQTNNSLFCAYPLVKLKKVSITVNTASN